MSALTKTLLVFSAAGLTLGVIAYGTLHVEYKPYGVPDRLRDEYEAKQASIRAKEEMLRKADELGNPIAYFPHTSHKFGLLDPHTTASHSFPVTNEGSSPLKLEVTSTSCKCTVGDLANNLLLPGETTEVTMTWNTGYKSEEYEQTTVVKTNDPVSPEVELKVSGTVKAELVVPGRVHLTTADPGAPSTGYIAIYSQTFEAFSILDVTSDLEGFNWEVEPMKLDHPKLIDLEPKSAMMLTVTAVGGRRGKFNGEIELEILPPNQIDPVKKTVKASGKVRAPINFYSTEIDSRTGLDMGTMISGEEHEFKVVVRARGQDAEQRKLEVLEVKPAELTASLKPLSRPGEYRLTVTVPADCSSVQFNRDDHHGYVEVGDPNDEDYSNWFPIMGAVVDVSN